MNLRVVVVPLILALVPAFAATAATKAPPSARCFKDGDAVGCFLERARQVLPRVQAPEARADALAELLYVDAATSREDKTTAAAAMALAKPGALVPHREMALLYAIDLYQFSQQSPLADAYREAVAHRFAELEKDADADVRLNLYTGACGMLAWEADFIERWSEWLPEACSVAKLSPLGTGQDMASAWVLAMLPLAATAGGEWAEYQRAAAAALGWLDSADRNSRKAARAERQLVARLGVVMYTVNALALDLFEEPDAAAGAIDKALRHLRRLEGKAGVTAESAPLRRAVAELLFRAGREREARQLIRQMLAIADADPAGKRLPLAEQVAVLALAANLEDLGAAGSCPAPQGDDVRET